MPRVASGFSGGSGMQVDAAERPKVRTASGPTIRSEAQYRRARDMLMAVARDAGYNRFDMQIIFGINPNHANRRLQHLRAAVGARGQRHGL